MRGERSGARATNETRRLPDTPQRVPPAPPPIARRPGLTLARPSSAGSVALWSTDCPRYRAGRPGFRAGRPAAAAHPPPSAGARHLPSLAPSPRERSSVRGDTPVADAAHSPQSPPLSTLASAFRPRAARSSRRARACHRPLAMRTRRAPRADGPPSERVFYAMHPRHGQPAALSLPTVHPGSASLRRGASGSPDPLVDRLLAVASALHCVKSLVHRDPRRADVRLYLNNCATPFARPGPDPIFPSGLP